MITDTGTLNELWSKLIVKELVHNGVRLFCLAPGSRLTPLVLAALEHPLVETHTHFDERGMSYYASGYAKASKLPTALIVTSGTAVSNLLPAITEAYHDQTPLIVITADRPPELRDCGANQTLDQVKIFNNFVQFQVDLPCPDGKISQNFIGTTIAHAVAKAKKYPGGPVHINCMLRKPLVTTNDNPFIKFHQSSRSPHNAQTIFSYGELILSPKEYDLLANDFSEHKNGVILVSGTTPIECLEPLYALSRLLQWPIFPDILSNVRSAGLGYGVIPYYDLILKSLGSNEDFTPDGILQIGDRFVSKTLFDWISSKKPKFHCHITPHLERKDSIHSVTCRIACDINNFIERLPNYLIGRSPSKWFKAWKELNDITAQSITPYFNEYSDLSEPYLFHHLASTLTNSTGLFLSNSMPIRNADSFFCPINPVGPIHCNRGLSGIDGNIGTASGITKALGKSVIAILGDLTFLHDLNSLAQIKNLPLKILVINNNGGSIFSFLPIKKNQETLTSFFQTPHGLDLKHAASLFNLPYNNPQSIEDLQKDLNNSSSMLIEIQTSINQNMEMHKDIHHHLKEIQNRLILTV